MSPARQLDPDLQLIICHYGFDSNSPPVILTCLHNCLLNLFRVTPDLYISCGINRIQIPQVAPDLEAACELTLLAKWVSFIYEEEGAGGEREDLEEGFEGCRVQGEGECGGGRGGGQKE